MAPTLSGTSLSDIRVLSCFLTRPAVWVIIPIWHREMMHLRVHSNKEPVLGFELRSSWF